MHPVTHEPEQRLFRALRASPLRPQRVKIISGQGGVFVCGLSSKHQLGRDPAEGQPENPAST